MRFGRRKPAPTRKQLRRAKPVRNAAVAFESGEDGGLLLKIPLTHRRAPVRVLARLWSAPPDKVVELEPVGAMVWNLCDGKHTIDNIANEIQREFKLTKVEAEASLLAFLETLMKRRYIHLEMVD